MNRALGLRAEAQQIHWAVVEGTRSSPILVAHDKTAAPVNLTDGPALSWYRTRIQLVVQAHSPRTAAVRSAEQIARGGNKEGSRRRLRIEGVLLQTLDELNLAVDLGALGMISKKLGSRHAKRYIESGDFRGLDLESLTPFAREAVLAAVAALPEN